MTEQKDKRQVMPIEAGAQVQALVPRDIDQAYRMSQALARGGDMIPKDFRGNPDAIFTAVARGAEIGLAPLQSLANIAVINGRASVWGDALPAIVQRAGHHLDVELVGEGDDMKAVATLTRGDTGKSIVREFSVADAKRAGLWGRKGPWEQYPKRMLSARARAFAVRDGAADAMMGMAVAEEMRDVEMKDVTPDPAPEPRRSAFAERIEQRRQKQEHPQPEEQGAVTIDGEAVEQDGGPTTHDEGSAPTVSSHEGQTDGAGEGEATTPDNTPAPDAQDWSDSPYWAEGQEAASSGFPDRDQCPYDDERRAAWLQGYDSVDQVV